MWSAERTDARVSNEVKTTNNAVGNTGRYVKNLLAGADGPYKACKSAYAAARAAHYSLTLPWHTNPSVERMVGPRLLPNLLFDRYLTEMSRLRNAAIDARNAFIDVYPDLVGQAQANLGGLANALDYPTPIEVEAAWRLSFDFQPIPARDGFSGFPDSVLDRLGQQLVRKQELALQASQSAMWERVRETVGHLAERLSDDGGKGRFHASTVEAVRELLTLLPGFDVVGDPRVATVVSEISAMLEGVDAEAIRKDSRTRQDVLGQAKAISDKLSSWGL